MSSPTDHVISAGPADLLRAAGFRKQARAFVRPRPDLWHVVRFDNGKLASAHFGHFHVWVLVVVPCAHEAIAGTAFPANPARAVASVSLSLRHFQGKAALPWAVAGAADVAAVAREIVAALRTGALSFLDGLDSLPAVADYLDATSKADAATAAIRHGPEHLAAIRFHQSRHAEATPSGGSPAWRR